MVASTNLGFPKFYEVFTYMYEVSITVTAAVFLSPDHSRWDLPPRLFLLTVLWKSPQGTSEPQC